MALRVLFLPLSGSDWKTSSSSLLLLKGEFISHVSLSESSLKLPPSESESFKIYLILSVPIKFLWNIFWIRTRSGIFHIACDARDIIWLVRTHWYLDLHVGERGHNGSLRLIAGVSCHKTKTWIESNVKTACCATVPSRESSIRTDTASRKVNKVTGTTHMGESNEETWSLYLQYSFFIKLMKFRKY